MENPIKMDDLGGPPLFLGQHPYQAGKQKQAGEPGRFKAATKKTSEPKAHPTFHVQWTHQCFFSIGGGGPFFCFGRAGRGIFLKLTASLPLKIDGLVSFFGQKRQMFGSNLLLFSTGVDNLRLNKTPPRNTATEVVF